MSSKPIFAAMVLSLAAQGVWAGHANPWASEDDELVMQYHDDNMEQSIGTPGEDEMKGVMMGHARGKLDDSVGASAAGGGGAGGGNGGGGRN